MSAFITRCISFSLSVSLFSPPYILQVRYRLREVGVPSKFLGSNIRQWSYVDENGLTRKCWALGSETYVKEACSVAEKQMKTHRLLHPLAHTDSTMKPGGLKVWSSSSFVMFQMLVLVPQSSSTIWRWCKPIPWWHLEPPTTDYKQIFNPQSLTHSFPK